MLSIFYNYDSATNLIHSAPLMAFLKKGSGAETPEHQQVKISIKSWALSPENWKYVKI